MTGRFRWWLAAAVLCVLAGLTAAQGAPATAKPGQRIIDRAARDAKKFLPQTGLGGDAKGKLEPDKHTFEKLKLEVEGCEKMEGYVSLPENLDKNKKYPLMFTFHGNGDVGQYRVKTVAKASTARDPIITIGVQYQQLTEEGKGKMGLPQLCSSEKIIEGSRWLLDKVMKEQPVDPERVFVSGFSWGTAWASGWAIKEWKDDPGHFPFRAVFLYSSPGYPRSKEDCPPVPFFCTVGDKETKVAGSVNVLASVRKFCNIMAAWGQPILYHEIPGQGHTVSRRCLQITRDAINEMGGPGALPYPGAGAAEADPLPFEASDDPYVKEVVALCNDDQWKAALDRVNAIKHDHDISYSDKKEVRHYDRDIEKVAKKEVKRLDELVAQAIKDEKLPAPWQVKRLRAITACWADESWIKGKGYTEHLATLDSEDFAPVKREREREKMMRDAIALESQDGKRADAKTLYEELAKRADEDDGKSIWPRAAKYRLSWWIDG